VVILCIMTEREPQAHDNPWQSPEVQVMLARHGNELIGCGMIAPYTAALNLWVKLLERDAHSQTAKSIQRSAELGGTLIADSVTYTEDGQTDIKEYVLIQVDPANGDVYEYSRVEVGEIAGDNVRVLFKGFKENQIRLLEQQVAERESLGIFL